MCKHNRFVKGNTELREMRKKKKQQNKQTTTQRTDTAPATYIHPPSLFLHFLLCFLSSVYISFTVTLERHNVPTCSFLLCDEHF